MSRMVIKVDSERVEELITVNEYLGVQQGHIPSVISMAAKCLFNEEAGEYYEEKEARTLIGKMPMKQLKQLVQTIGEEMEDQAIPPKPEIE